MSDIWPEIFETAPSRTFPRGAHLFRREDRITDCFLVLEGTVSLARALSDGGALVLHRAEAGALVAEASLFAKRYHCDGICEAPTRLAVLPRAQVVAALEGGAPALAALAQSAREVQGLRTRLEVMRLRTVRARLDAYLDLHGPPGPGGWVRVADWIGTSPEALYRELARRRQGAGAAG